MRRVLAALLVGTILGACSSVGPGPSGTLSITDLSAEQQRLVADGDIIPPQQQQYVVDGVVTRSEYRAAMQNAADCVASRGWSASIEKTPNGELQLGVTFKAPPSAEEEDRSGTDTLDCLATYSDAVTQMYLNSQAP